MYIRALFLLFIILRSLFLLCWNIQILTYFVKSNQIYKSIHKANKNKSYVSKLPHAFVFRCMFDSAKFKVWNFFACLIFLCSLLWTCLSKYTRKDMTDTMKHFEQQTSSILCSFLYLVHPKSSSIFQSCDWLKSDTSAAQKKKNVRKKMHLGQVFQSVTSFET